MAAEPGELTQRSSADDRAARVAARALAEHVMGHPSARVRRRADAVGSDMPSDWPSQQDFALQASLDVIPVAPAGPRSRRIDSVLNVRLAAVSC